MNNKILNIISAFLLLPLFIISCKGTSTDEYLSGDFINDTNDKTPPSAILPIEGDMVFNSKVVLQWTSKKNAAYYTVEIAENKDADFSVQIAGSPFTVYAPDTVLAVDLPAASATYCWRVRADSTSSGLYGQSYFESMDDSVYVYCPDSVTTPNDTGMAGNKSKPFQTIMYGIAKADSLNLKAVKVATRGGSSIYNEVVVLREGISMYGGYTAEFTESNRDSAVNRTIINGEHGMTVRAKDIVLATVFDGFVVQTQDDGVNSYAVHVDSCYYDLTVQNCEITGAVSDSSDIESYGIYIKNSYCTVQDNTINGGNLDGSDTSASGVGIFQGDPVIYKNNITGGDASYFSYGIYTDSGNPEIINNQISGGNNVNQLSCGIRFANDSSSLVMDNTITGGSATLSSNGARMENNTNKSTFINNIITGGVANYTCGFFLDESLAHILNNTIIGGNGNNGIYGMMITGTERRPWIYNNIVITVETDTTRYGIYGEPWGHTNNCYYAVGSNGTYDHCYDPDDFNFPLNNELTEDPNLDLTYKLQSSSDVDIRYGGLNFSYPRPFLNQYPFNTDKDGNTRTTSTIEQTGQSFGDGWSMGAYEY